MMVKDDTAMMEEKDVMMVKDDTAMMEEKRRDDGKGRHCNDGRKSDNVICWNIRRCW